ncbi:MAG: hypothetical protein WDO12_05850 [Pseudomonadota bacterium]
MAVSSSSDAGLAGFVESRFAQLAEQAPRTMALLDAQPALRVEAANVLLGSDFALRAMLRDDGLLEALWGSGALSASRGPHDYTALLEVLHPDQTTVEADALRSLRQLRTREMLRLAWRDLAGSAAVHDTLRETSWFADSVIAAATRMAAALLVPRHGRSPHAGDELMVLAMGKLGGSELNFSSDIDLIFLYPRGGESTGPAALDLGEYYTRQGRLLIRLLDTVTEDGFVFRVRHAPAAVW